MLIKVNFSLRLGLTIILSENLKLNQNNQSFNRWATYLKTINSNLSSGSVIILILLLRV